MKFAFGDSIPKFKAGDVYQVYIGMGYYTYVEIIRLPKLDILAFKSVMFPGREVTNSTIVLEKFYLKYVCKTWENEKRALLRVMLADFLIHNRINQLLQITDFKIPDKKLTALWMGRN